MFLTDIANRDNIPVLEKVLAFAEARQGVLIDNVANIDTPDYRARRLDPQLFLRTLRRAIEDRGSNHADGTLEIRRTEQFHIDDRGHLQLTPVHHPPGNILFHDRTNARLEALMSQVAENVMTYNIGGQLLRNQFDALKTAIRGQV